MSINNGGEHIIYSITGGIFIYLFNSSLGTNLPYKQLGHGFFRAKANSLD